MVCPLLISLLAASEEEAALAGISAGNARQRMLLSFARRLRITSSLVQQSRSRGPSFAETWKPAPPHLKVCSPQLGMWRDVYTTLAEAALRNLPNREATESRKALRKGISATNSKASNRKARKETRKER